MDLEKMYRECEKEEQCLAALRTRWGLEPRDGE